jgi:hypothetical protein
VRVPLPVVQASAGSSHPLQVVVVGRFVADEPASCAGSGRDCGEGFVIGGWRIVTIDPALDSRVRRRRSASHRCADGVRFDRTLLLTAMSALDTGESTRGGAADAAGVAAHAVASGPARIERGYDPTRYPLGEAPPRLVWLSSTTRPVPSCLGTMPPRPRCVPAGEGSDGRAMIVSRSRSWPLTPVSCGGANAALPACRWPRPSRAGNRRSMPGRQAGPQRLGAGAVPTPRAKPRRGAGSARDWGRGPARAGRGWRLTVIATLACGRSAT